MCAGILGCEERGSAGAKSSDHLTMAAVSIITPRAFDAVVWDYDGTLVDTRSGDEAAVAPSRAAARGRVVMVAP